MKTNKRIFMGGSWLFICSLLLPLLSLFTSVVTIEVAILCLVSGAGIMVLSIGSEYFGFTDSSKDTLK